MMDIKIGNSGDFVMRAENCFETFKITFSMGRQRGFKIGFQTAAGQFRKRRGSLRIAFDTRAKNRFPAARTVMDGEEIAQAVRIAARTPLNALRRLEGFGSRCAALKHEDLSDKLLREVKEETEGILKRLNLGDAYRVAVRKELGEGYFYCQNVSVYIYAPDALIYKFSL